ncbi:alpha/beta fold hydrolase [Nocardioides sp. TF02-7]|uniref:alpha/beta fold hydrolase n=1 Tax=Nocardioides sp. TF02-7 TaxID=2917724 RepID=UPI001F06E061|nr:alpha/beta fold hydrolase [Nocardioides sp. TF02-7]UMG94112.1 alpha/beta hydrolase [Nocardioides sp. TF02-7]
MTEPQTRTLDVPGGTIAYDVRDDAAGRGRHRALVMAGFPMDATGFASLAAHFRDRVVVTYDPRGTGRSTRPAGEGPSTPVDHAADLHALITALGMGPVDVLGSSGGAVTGLALVAAHPDQVHTLVAHEPPVAAVLPDRDQQLTALADVHETYQRRGTGPAMAKFLTLIGRRGPLPADFAALPAPDPADFGLPTRDDGRRDDPMLGQSILTTAQYEPDFAALARASTRIRIAAGVESEGEMMARAAAGVAERLGTELAIFPGGHGGFLGGEFGQHGDPEDFAAALRRLLDER